MTMVMFRRPSIVAVVTLLKLLLLVVTTTTKTTHAFGINTCNQKQHHQQHLSFHTTATTTTTTSSLYSSSPKEEGEKEPMISKSPMEDGSQEELMYALGVNLARQLGDIRPLIDNGDELANVAKGLLDVVVGRLSDDGQRILLSKRGKELNALIAERADRLKEKLKATGKQMLTEMAQNDNTTVLESGVVLHLLEAGPDGPGEGKRPTKSSTVKVHYHGTLPDGTIFDSTLLQGNPDQPNEPVKFPLAGVIPGWQDALLKMHEGETCMIGIPPEQAYGDEGTPDGRIPGGSTLFFKVQLLEIMTAAIGGSPTLLDATGNEIKKDSAATSALLGADGNPL